MESKTKELVKAGRELVVLLGNQHGMIDAASLVQRLTAQLDITAAALREMTKKRDDEHADVLAWEKTMFKVCGEDGTKSVAAKFALLEDRCDQLAAENVDLKNVFGPGDAVMNFLTIALRHTTYDEIDLSDVTLAFRMSLPQTPATDARQREQMAKGVEMFAEMTEKVSAEEDFYDNGESAATLKYVAKQATLFASQLRNGEAV